MKVKIDYDDQVLDIVEKLNRELIKHGLSFEDDMLEHDGYIVLTLIKVK